MTEKSNQSEDEQAIAKEKKDLSKFVPSMDRDKAKLAFRKRQIFRTL